MNESIAMLNGFTVVESPFLSDKLNEHTFRNERKWAHRKMWKREERFKHIPTGIMTSTVYCTNGMLFVSPAQAKLIREGSNRDLSVCTHVADPNNKIDYISPETDRFRSILGNMVDAVGVRNTPNPIFNLKGI